MLHRRLNSVAVLLLIIIAVVSCTDKMVAPPLPPNPIADFNWSGVTIIPAQITFQNLSANADSYLWTFGDSTASNDTNPTHIYTQPGLYTVTLSAHSTRAGVSDFKTIRLPIDADAVVADFSMPATALTSADVTFENHSRYAGAYRWNIGDGRVLEAVSPTVSYSDYRTYTIKLTAFSRDGQRSDTCSKALVVTPGRVYLDSVFVLQYPARDPSNQPWDPGPGQDGPDLFWTMQTPAGSEVKSIVENNAFPAALPIGWRTPGSALLLPDWEYPYILKLYDYDAPDSVLMGTAGFTVNQLRAGGVYPHYSTIGYEQMRMTIVLRWM